MVGFMNKTILESLKKVALNLTREDYMTGVYEGVELGKMYMCVHQEIYEELERSGYDMTLVKCAKGVGDNQ